MAHSSNVVLKVTRRRLMAWPSWPTHGLSLLLEVIRSLLEVQAHTFEHVCKVSVVVVIAVAVCGLGRRIVAPLR